LLIRAPGAAPVPGQSERGHQHQVESRIEPSEIRTRQQESFGSASNPPPLPRRQCRCRRVEFLARLDLDDRENAATARQDVDLAGRAAPVACQNLPAPQPQMPQTEPFGKAPAALRPFSPIGGMPLRLSHASPLRIARARRYSSPRGKPVSAAILAAASRTPTSATARCSRRSISARSGS